MDAVERAVAQLTQGVADESLAQLCRDLGLKLLTMFGSAVRDPSTARDVDLAYQRDRDRPHVSHLDIVNALGERYGDSLDVMDLDAADSVARFAGLHGVEVLYEAAPGDYAEAQLAAFRAFCDTQWLRDRALEVLAK
ncbi:MAG: hypothetical protein Q4G51_03025 [Dermatophilus congolensis]|nr:hypothetical protein [Dermatophilus congolensis]